MDQGGQDHSKPQTNQGCWGQEWKESLDILCMFSHKDKRIPVSTDEPGRSRPLKASDQPGVLVTGIERKPVNFCSCLVTTTKEYLFHLTFLVLPLQFVAILRKKY